MWYFGLLEIPIIKMGNEITTTIPMGIELMSSTLVVAASARQDFSAMGCSDRPNNSSYVGGLFVWAEVKLSVGSSVS